MEAKLAARKDIVENRLLPMLKRLDQVILKYGKGGYSVGSTLTIADLIVYVQMSIYAEGHLDGVPTDMIKEFAGIQGVFDTVNGNVKVKAFEAQHAK